MPFVLDNSILMAWVLEEGSDYADAVGGRLAAARALTPSIWPLEFSNVLLAAERRGRLTEAIVGRIRDMVAGLPIEVVPDHPDRVMSVVLQLARQHGLTVYDASYLDLAIRTGSPLASLDKQLTEAAERCGVPLVAG